MPAQRHHRQMFNKCSPSPLHHYRSAHETSDKTSDKVRWKKCYSYVNIINHSIQSRMNPTYVLLSVYARALVRGIVCFNSFGSHVCLYKWLENELLARALTCHWRIFIFVSSHNFWLNNFIHMICMQRCATPPSHQQQQQQQKIAQHPAIYLASLLIATTLDFWPLEIVLNSFCACAQPIKCDTSTIWLQHSGLTVQSKIGW